MYDFTRFMDELNLSKDIKKALELIKIDFHLGKIEVKSDDPLKCSEYIIDSNYNKKIINSYLKNDYEFNFYKNSDNHKYTENELNDINILLSLLSLYHYNIYLNKRAEESEFISHNTKIPNAQGFMKNIIMISSSANILNYNGYYINLKGFGLVNRLYNSDIGDLAIKYYANSLKDFIDNDETIGHLGGDNFVALIKKERHQKFIDTFTGLSVTIQLNNLTANLNLVGVIGFVDVSDNSDIKSLISNSSIACQYARANKKLVVKLTPELLEMDTQIKNIEKSFKDELNNGNFIVYYQPKFDIESGKIVGVEALSRWINNGKIVPPIMFVPVLEKNGEILDLDLFVLENLCKDIHNFRNMGHNIVPASCNLSRKDFENPDLEDRVINIIKKYNVRSEDIVIEVTETTNLEENARLAKFINAMWKNGIMTSIDDFGTGYSSLSVLRDFKVNEIKIDRSFINRDNLSQSDEIILGSIIDMAKRLNISVICEGVETKKQAEFLVKLGCYKAQGFYYSKPVPKLEFEDMLLRIGSVYD